MEMMRAERSSTLHWMFARTVSLAFLCFLFVAAYRFYRLWPFANLTALETSDGYLFICFTMLLCVHVTFVIAEIIKDYVHKSLRRLILLVLYICMFVLCLLTSLKLVSLMVVF